MGTKHELRNDLAVDAGDGSGGLKVDRAAVHTRAVKDGLNWDNLFFRNLPDNAVGLRVNHDLEDEDPTAQIQMPVAQLTLPGYAEGAEDGTVLDGISTVVKLYQNGGTKWEEYAASDPVRGANAALVSLDGNWHLSLELHLNKRAQLSGLLRRCLLVDLRFHLTDPVYSVPNWVNNLHVDEFTGDIALKVGLRQFVEQVNEAKQNSYSGSVDTSQGYLGNLLLFVNY